MIGLAQPLSAHRKHASPRGKLKIGRPPTDSEIRLARSDLGSEGSKLPQGDDTKHHQVGEQ
jgi:hypothetical protein